MNDQRFIELWNDFLEGGLGEPELHELHEKIANDDRLLKMAADSYQLHRLVGFKMRGDASSRERFVQDAIAKLPSVPSEFIDDVMHRIDASSHPLAS